ncbi:MAG: hypothetical protein ACPG7F_08525 [Aggregatilineales bacterium]
MTYFSQQDADDLTSGQIQDVYNRIDTLHRQLVTTFKKRDYELQAYQDVHAEHLHPASVSSMKSGKMLTLQYMRLKQKAMTIERLMGRDDVLTTGHIDSRRHPVIELRLNPSYFAVELILSPDAWWDQQNLAGKLSITRHRKEFFKQLIPLETALLGYWEGVHQDEMRIESTRFHPQVLTEWLSTFAPGKDWFRLGVWYPLADFALTDDDIHDEITTQISRLYPIYQALLWRSDNNFREFYKAKS